MKKNLYINSETGIYTWKTKSPFTWKDSVYIKMLLQIISIDHIYMTRLLRNKSHQKKKLFNEFIFKITIFSIHHIGCFRFYRRRELFELEKSLQWGRNYCCMHVCFKES